MLRRVLACAFVGERAFGSYTYAMGTTVKVSAHRDAHASSFRITFLRCACVRASINTDLSASPMSKSVHIGNTHDMSGTHTGVGVCVCLLIGGQKLATLPRHRCSRRAYHTFSHTPHRRQRIGRPCLRLRFFVGGCSAARRWRRTRLSPERTRTRAHICAYGCVRQRSALRRIQCGNCGVCVSLESTGRCTFTSRHSPISLAEL